VAEDFGLLLGAAAQGVRLGIDLAAVVEPGDRISGNPSRRPLARSLSMAGIINC
jgi:hypothetical protein